ncbi:DNA/RNA non-specific endonuclease [Pseudarthrobacter sp. SSS035]|uniref:DNA/RNA non-specific endonuclease n=1 Tax=Pseudarthrobacter sp. SSS035 TaxID=2931399 RepID=UPI002010B70B|nr:DNA/RNA non-specific endonuclease [Pseudarthrobacter sp. SSS035]
MALSPEVCTQTGSSGLDPSGGLQLPDVDSLDAAAADLTTHSAAFRSGIDAASRTWSGLGSSYVSEESPTVLAAFTKVSPLAAKVSDDAQLTSKALTTFSSTCRDLRQRLEACGRSVRDLDTDIDAFPTSVEKTTMVKDQQITTQVQQHWGGDADLTGRRNALAAELQAIHNDYLSAQDTCAAALAGVSGGEPHTAERPVSVDLRSGSWFDEALYDAGTLMGIDHGGEQTPWGEQTVPYRPNGVLGFLQGMGAGAVELVDGVWSLTGTGNDAKRDQAWGGMNAMMGNAGTLASVPLTWAFNRQQWEKDKPGIQRALDDYGAMGAAFIHLENHEGGNQNIGRDIGGAVFNMGSLFVGGGALTKTGTMAGKAGLAADRLSIATMDSARLGKLSTTLSSTAQGLYSTSTVLTKPGSLALKVSDILMPDTTAKVLDGMTKVRVGVFTTLDTVKSTAAENLTGARRAVGTGLAAAADGIRAVDDAVPRTDFALAHGAVTHAGGPKAADWLDNKAASIGASNPPAFAPPKGPTAGAAAVTNDLIRPEPFTKPAHVSDTVVLRHGDSAFPIHRKENFADRAGLRPNTEYIIEHRSLMKDDAGVVDKNTVEKYYTDGTGTVTRVDTYAGVKGAWSPELNKPVANVTYNVVAQVDGGMQNTFTLVMDSKGHLASAKGHITSTLVGDMNRNGYQQLKAGRLGGKDYDGGHAAPSALGFIGERAGLFPQHSWQNRGKGAEIDSVQFGQVESEVIGNVKRRLASGESVSLNWSMTTVASAKPGLPATFRLRHGFAGGKVATIPFNNLPKS